MTPAKIAKVEAAARALLAALKLADEALGHLNGYHESTKATIIRAALAQAEAAGIE
jgi:hypothetical protein